MPDDAAREAATWRGIMAEAADRLRDRGPPPRVFAAAAAAIADHGAANGLDRRTDAESVAFWSFGLAAALAARPGLVEEPSRDLPDSFARVRDAIAEHAAVPQLAFAILHMPALMPMAMLLEEAHRRGGGARPHVLVQRRNFASLDPRLAALVHARVEVVQAGPRGARQLGRALRGGAVTRLLVFPDGPARPGAPRARGIPALGEGLAFGGGALRLCFRHGLPVLPLVHHFEAGRLVVQPRPLVLPDRTGPDPAGRFVAAVLDPLGGILRARPEQWLLWAGVAVRR